MSCRYVPLFSIVADAVTRCAGAVVGGFECWVSLAANSSSKAESHYGNRQQHKAGHHQNRKPNLGSPAITSDLSDYRSTINTCPYKTKNPPISIIQHPRL